MNLAGRSLLVLALGGQPALAGHLEKLAIPLSSGRVLEAQVRFPVLPTNAKTKIFPAVLVFGGFQNAARVLDEIESIGFANQAVLASFDYPFDPPRRFQFPQSLTDFPEVRRMLHDTLEGIPLLAEKLSKDPRIRPEIVALGASLGAPLVAISAARSPQISEVVLIHGFGKVPHTLAWQFERSWRERWGIWSVMAPALSRMMAYGAWQLAGLPEPESEVPALRSTQQVLWIAAERDTFIPRESSQSLREALHQSKASVEEMLTAGDHVQPGAVAIMRDLGRISVNWLSKVRSDFQKFSDKKTERH